MKLLRALSTLIVLWALSVLTVYILKGWGPIAALFKYTGQGTYLQAGGLLAAVVVMLLVLLYVFGKIAELAGAGKLVQGLLHLPRTLFGP